MAYSRYPRRGHRLAPATLRELLQEPVPERYIELHKRKGMRLADLDESAWARFGRRTCEALAGEVVSAVGRAVRVPLPIGDRLLPTLPEGITLAELDLEVRTVNCLVAAGIHERPQDLNGMTLDGVLSLRGFWSKSLVDLLTALEYVVDHPEGGREPEYEGSTAPRRVHVPNRYPRPNHRVAPSLLERLLQEPIPSHLLQGSGFPGTCLADLDETAWKHFSPEEVGQLAGMVVSRIAVGVFGRNVQRLPLPAVPPGVRLEDLKLENRTYNCLRRARLAGEVERFGELTVADLMEIPAFGAKCLVDVLTAIEALSSSREQADETLLEQAKKFEELPEAAAIHFSDPRLGRLLRSMASEGNTVGELLDRVQRCGLQRAEAFRLAEGMGQLEEQILRCQALSVEEELKDVFAPTANERDLEILAAYHNWDGQGSRTLERLGQKYGLSRERIRQICTRCIKRVQHAPIFAPVLDRTLDFIAQRLPRSTRALEQELQEAGLSRHGLSVAAIEDAARFFSRTPPFHVVTVADGAVAVDPSESALPLCIAQAAKGAIGSFGAASVADVQSELARHQPRQRVSRQLLRETLTALAEFEWLDARRSWFRLDSLPQYGLSNMIEKVVSVAGRIDISRLRTALGRYRRSGRALPPPAAILEYCRPMARVHVEADTVCAEPSLDWRTVLAGVERGMVEVLKEFGPVMERGDFEEQCVRRGMNRFSFNAILMCSPVVTQYGRSIYGLVAEKTDPKMVRRARSQRSRTASGRVLRKCGVEGEGRPFVVYCLSKAAISGGVITIPAALKEDLVGEYTVVSAHNERLGRLTAKRGCGWGLGPALRGSGAQPGDYLFMHFDNVSRTVRLRLGDVRLLDDHCPPGRAASMTASSVTGLPS